MLGVQREETLRKNKTRCSGSSFLDAKVILSPRRLRVTLGGKGGRALPIDYLGCAKHSSTLDILEVV